MNSIKFTVLTGKGQIHFEFDPNTLEKDETLLKFVIGAEPDKEFVIFPMVRYKENMFYGKGNLEPVKTETGFYGRE